MRLTILAALLLALGCAKKPPPAEEDPAAKVCTHIRDVCGTLTNYDVCVSSAKAMRAANLEGAKEAEACALAKTTCQEISLCSMQSSKKIIRTSLRNVKQKLENAKQELDPPPPAPAAPESTSSAPAPAR